MTKHSIKVVINILEQYENKEAYIASIIKHDIDI